MIKMCENEVMRKCVGHAIETNNKQKYKPMKHFSRLLVSLAMMGFCSIAGASELNASWIPANIPDVNSDESTLPKSYCVDPEQEITKSADQLEGMRAVITDANGEYVWSLNASNRWDVGSVPIAKWGSWDDHCYVRFEKPQGDYSACGVDGDIYTLIMVNAAGEPYLAWGGTTGALNMQPVGENVLFALGMGKNFGQDGDYLGLWKVEYEAGNGYVLQNVGRTYVNSSARYATPASSAPVSERVYVKLYSDLQEVAAEGTAVINMGNTPGSLSDKLYAQGFENSGVVNLIIKGKVNDDDLEVIKSMENLSNLDMSGVTNMTATPEYWMEDHDALTTVILPSNLKVVSGYTFSDCSSLMSVSMPNSVTELGYYAFSNCQKLQEINLSSGLKSIGNNCFYNTKKLGAVVIPEGVTSIGYAAFQYSGIESVSLPYSLREIENMAFYGCDNLTRVVIPEGFENLGYGVFGYCQRLETVTLPSTLKQMDRSFYSCYNIKTVYNYSFQPVNMPNDYSFSSLTDATLFAPEMSLNKFTTAKGYEGFKYYKPLLNYRPNYIMVHDELALVLPTNQPADYKPSMSIEQRNLGGEIIYGGLTLYNANDDTPSTLNLKDFSIVADPNYDINNRGYYNTNTKGYYGSLVNNANLSAESVTVNTFVPAEEWTYLAFPFKVKVADVEDIFPEQVKAMRRYSSENRAKADMQNTWLPIGSDEIINAGEGFAMNVPIRYADNSYEWYSGFRFKAMDDAEKNAIFANDDVTVSIKEFADSETLASNRSWNFIGNPYPAFFNICYMDYESPIVVWDARNDTYNTYVPADGDEYALRPFESFFCQKPADVDAITFYKEGRQTDAKGGLPASAKVRNTLSSDRLLINLTLSDGEMTDRTRVVINENATADYDLGRDASKFMSNNSNATQIYSVSAKGERFSINERPLAEGTVTLGTQFGKTGTYTLALGNHGDAAVVLTDLLTGKSINLTENAEGYTFEAQAGQSGSRFVLSIALDSSATSIASLMQKAQKQTEAIYTIDGRKVSSMKSAGTYIVKGANGVEKFIVK